MIVKSWNEINMQLITVKLGVVEVIINGFKQITRI